MDSVARTPYVDRCLVKKVVVLVQMRRCCVALSVVSVLTILRWSGNRLAASVDRHVSKIPWRLSLSPCCLLLLSRHADVRVLSFGVTGADVR